MTATERLVQVQEELKAPKGQYNAFGKYSYRSCEDIVEAVKPILSKYGLALTLSDELVQIGERYYVKATATITATITATDGDDYGTAVRVTAFAREAETKTGMDAAQITGSASSYARKYALNGLFAIDDTKDADATNTGDAPKKSASASTTCANCGKPIVGVLGYSALDVAKMNKARFGRELCATCSTKLKAGGNKE